jgi:hypothetical protein
MLFLVFRETMQRALEEQDQMSEEISLLCS